MKEKIVTFGLCEGRHEIPCKNYLFECEVNPLDVQGLETKAFETLLKAKKGAYECHIYVTGLTVALIAAINGAKRAGYHDIVLYHYDRNSDSYYPQRAL